MRVAGALPLLHVAGFAPRIQPHKPIRPEPKANATTKVYAARQLLALGPLSFGEFMEITGWPFKTCRRVLSYLVDDLGEVERLGRMYLVTNGKQLPDVRPLEAKAEPSNGETPDGPMRTETSMAILSAAALMPKTQAGCG